MIFLLFTNCQKDKFNLDNSNENELLLVKKARSHYSHQSLTSRTSQSVDSINLLYALDPNWSQAEILTSGMNDSFVIVPIIISDSTALDSLKADLLFYNDQCGMTLELWVFPFLQNSSSTNYRTIINGKVLVLNECYQSTLVFYINNGSTYFMDSVSSFHNFNNNLQTRTPKIKCPTWKENGWSKLGDVWDSIITFFGGGGGPSGGNNGGNNGSGGSSDGGGWSGRGSWSGSNNNTGGNNNNYGGSPPTSGNSNYNLTSAISNFNNLNCFHFDINNKIHQSIITFCLTENDINKCILLQLTKRGVEEEVLEDCWKNYYKAKYGLTDEEWNKANTFMTENEFDLIPDYVNYVKDCNSSNDFEKCIINKLLNSVENPDPCQNPGKQKEEIVDCNSFNFIRAGAGQIACIEDLRVYRYHPLLKISEKIGPFCFSVTLPYITFDNNVITSGHAQECAAWALNEAAGYVDAVQVISPKTIPAFLYKKMIKESFIVFLGQSSCTNGYKTVAECNSQNCTNPRSAIYLPGCGWTMSENDYGCK